MRRVFSLIAVFLLVGFGAFYNSFQGPFIFDDIRSIVENEHIRTLWPPWEVFRDTTRPLVQLTLALNYAISGSAVWSYHLLNLLIHIAAALTLFAVARLTLLRYCTGWLRDSAFWLALVIALSWMVHPLQTESVTYVIQRGEALMGLFCLGTLLCFILSVGSTHANRWRICSLLCCLLGLMTKPVMLIAPLLVLVYDRTFIAQTFAAALRSRWRYYVFLSMVVSLLPVILGGNRKDWATSVGSEVTGISSLQYASNQPGIVLRYLRLSFWPDALCLDYGFRPDTNLAAILGSLLAIALLLALTVWACQRRSPGGFAAAWFFLTLAPTSSFVPIADLAFEHRMYLALAGLLALTVPATGLFLHRILERFPSLPVRKGVILASLSLLFGGLLTGRTILRNDDYSSEIAIWSSATQVSPTSARAHYNLGTALMRKQRWTEAVNHFQAALRARPSYPEAHYNLANALHRLDLLPEAILSYRRALTLTPEDWQAHNNLGVAMLKSGDNVSAEIEFKRTLQLNPDCSSAQWNIAKIRESAAPRNLAVSLP